MAGQSGMPSAPHSSDAPFAVRPRRALPAWRSALAVVAHPDDETFGLGAVIDAMTSAGSAVHVLCFTRGEASTLNERNADLSVVWGGAAAGQRGTRSGDRRAVRRPAGEVDICVRVSRARQRRAALQHASQISPAGVLWRRLQMQGDYEHLRWL